MSLAVTLTQNKRITDVAVSDMRKLKLKAKLVSY